MYPPDKVTLPNVNENDLDDVPPIGRKMARPQGDHKKVIEHKQWRRAVQGYLASISFVDTCVGMVIDALDRSDYTDNTIVILWSDHGWHLGEKLHWRKFSLWEEATHNVLMAIVPGVTKPNQRCGRPVTMLDIYPTLIELCNLSKKDELQGKSLVPLLKNPQAEWTRPALTTHGHNNHSLRSERFRYIRYSDGTEELYDHQKDDLEWDNLANDPKYAEVKKQLAKWLPITNVPEIIKAE
jgi:arylsulfatase A-like enzyme